MSVADLESFADQIAANFGLNPDVFRAQLQQESGFNPNAVNGNAVGIAQFMPATAAQYGLADPTDPYASIAAAGNYDATLLAQNGGDYMQMLQSYGTLTGNAGPGSSIWQKFSDLVSGNSSTTASASGTTNQTMTQATVGNSYVSNFIAKYGTNAMVIAIGILFVAAGVFGMTRGN